MFYSKAQEIEWMNINDALVKLQNEPRKLLVDVYTDWCGWCKVMDKSTYSDTNIIEYINDKYYPVKLNAEQKENIIIGDKTFKFIQNGSRGYHELAAYLLNGNLGYPATVIIDENSNIIQIISGYKKAPEFDLIINFFGDNHYLSKSFADFQKNYSSPYKN